MTEMLRVLRMVALLSLVSCTDEGVSAPGDRVPSAPDWGLDREARMDIDLPPLMDHGEDPIGADDLVLVADYQPDARGLRAENGLVYWASTGGDQSRIVFVQADNGNSEILELGPATPHGALAFDGRRVWFADPYEGTVMVATLGEFGAVKFAEALGVPLWVTATDTNVYWATAEGDLVAAPKSSGDSSLFLSGPTGPSALTTDGERLYWSTEQATALLWTSIDGGPHQAYAADGAYTSHLVLDETRLYWLAAEKNVVQSVSKSGGTVRNLAENQPGLAGLAVDRFFVYFTTSEGSVKRVNKDGSGLVELATHLSTLGEIAVDHEWIYVVHAGSLMKFAK
jgi:hypothetical protein